MHYHSQRYQQLLDRFGVSASTLCAIHCAAVPFLISILPAVGLGFLGGRAFELSMIGISTVLATFSLGSSYRVHRKLNPLMMMSTGIMLMLFNVVGHESHTELAETLHPYLAALGGLMIASAHWLNMRLCRQCDLCDEKCDVAHHQAGEHSHAHPHGDHLHHGAAARPSMAEAEPREEVA
ncbi:MAG: MerC domain-containing protein [Bacteroidetes bacterium]|nr:MerC domain-containing protein [Bacteroidota bacterium]